MVPIIRNKKLALEWGLRIIIALIFISRAIPSFLGAEEWISLFTNIGVSASIARLLLFFIGISDTTIAILLFVKPMRIAIIWAAIWPIAPAIGTFLAGSSIEHELLHYGSLIVVTVALLFIRGFPKNIKQLWI